MNTPLRPLTWSVAASGGSVPGDVDGLLPRTPLRSAADRLLASLKFEGTSRFPVCCRKITVAHPSATPYLDVVPAWNPAGVHFV